MGVTISIAEVRPDSCDIFYDMGSTSIRRRRNYTVRSSIQGADNCSITDCTGGHGIRHGYATGSPWIRFRCYFVRNSLKCLVKANLSRCNKHFVGWLVYTVNWLTHSGAQIPTPTSGWLG